MNRVDRSIAEAEGAVDRVTNAKGRVTTFGTTEFPCGCVMGYHRIAELVQWKPCMKHGAAPELLDALEGLFEHCAMIHKHWGENSNAKEADLAIKLAEAAIRKAKGER